MKKIFYLFLSLLLLFCCACHKEEQPEVGTLYTSGSNTYNTHIRMVLTTTELNAPIKSLTVEIQNDTDYTLMLGVFDDWEWETWENGQWVTVIQEEVKFDILYTDLVNAQSAKSYTEYFGDPLGAGIYRLQKNILAKPNAFSSPDDEESFECTLEIYFTVTESTVSQESTSPK